MSETRVAVYDGKYTFICPEGDWVIHVLRYDEPWIIIKEGHKAVLALMGELLEAQEQALKDKAHFKNTNALMAAAVCAAPEATCAGAQNVAERILGRPACPGCPACRFNDLRARLRGLAEGQEAAAERPVLMTCGRCNRADAYATCIGSYNGEREAPSCDECCGHDTTTAGYCWSLQQAAYVRSLKKESP